MTRLSKVSNSLINVKCKFYNLLEGYRCHWWETYNKGKRCESKMSVLQILKAIHVRVRPSNGYLSTEYPFDFSPFVISTVIVYFGLGGGRVLSTSEC